MVLNSRTRFVYVVALLACGLWPPGSLSAQTSFDQPPEQPVVGNYDDYVVGPHDVLAIACRDEPSLTGRFTVEADRTFTYPHIGRVRVGGLTLREVEAELRNRLMDGEFFRDPQIMVVVEYYRSQKIFVVGAVRTPGTYSLSGNMRLIEALALAGSTLPTASGEAVIVRQSNQALVIDQTHNAGAPDESSDQVVRVDLRALENGDLSQNVALRNSDTVFVLRAESVYVFGQVRNPGAYPLRQKNTTVLQALSLAGGVTDRGSMGRIRIVRIVDSEKKEVRVELTDFVRPHDTIVVPKRFF